MKRRLGLEIAVRFFFAHPIKSFKGFLKYQRHSFQAIKLPPVVVTSSKPLCLGAYCQKPHDCPAKRFTHRCFFVETLNLYSACQRCELKDMVEIAILLRSPFYIMTTALDLLLDVFLSQKFSTFMTMICGYAKQLFLFPAFVFDMKGIFFILGRGSCRNYKEFLWADEGYKVQQTFLAPLAKKKFYKLYEYIKGDIKEPFVFQDNFYYPRNSM